MYDAWLVTFRADGVQEWRPVGTGYKTERAAWEAAWAALPDDNSLDIRPAITYPVDKETEK